MCISSSLYSIIVQIPELVGVAMRLLRRKSVWLNVGSVVSGAGHDGGDEIGRWCM